jgi:hypothetical protein
VGIEQHGSSVRFSLIDALDLGMPLGISSLMIITTRGTEAYVVLLRFINCYLVAVFGTALSVRCDTYDAQLDALPKGSIGLQLLSFSRECLLPRLLC